MRYAGSKRRFAKYIVPILENEIKKNTIFVDAFCGGCNILSSVNCQNKIGIELNKYVYATWEQLKKNKMLLIPNALSEEEYNDIKYDYINQGKKHPDWLIGYVGSACSYGGSWFNGYARYNKKRNEDHIKEAYNGLKQQIDEFLYIEKTKFVNCSYDEYDYPKNCVIYCDPPYVNTKKYETDFDTEKFWNWVRKMSMDGHKIFVSEYIAPEDFKCIWSFEKKDGMGTIKDGGKQKIKIEKLFIYNG